ncbi:protein ecdysoneless homolog [Saccoglossus kowalevskii]|uniref:Protein SGT1 homolog n=1 Tax=Saccoglossus kowalevskii TaxID=10224 RepID=A0ABM0LWD1_SACKO|nr:PREDICTED: protein SGT1 homolog [Saccoglossus kowalevskii]
MAGVEHVEDVVEYFLFIKYDQLDSEVKSQKEAAEESLDKYLAYLSSHLVDYIWQRDPFNIRIVPGVGGNPTHLHGITNYGDNIEDEWFIVYLLFQLTEVFPELTVKISDSDGEFLLIEAADYLPKWLDPDTSINRVFIQNGQLHIIPLPVSPADIGVLPTESPTLQISLQTVYHHPHRTVASTQIQQAVRRKLQNVVQSGLITAYKACRRMKYFPPDERIMTTVKMTRCLYGQLLQQRFQPDKSSGWNLPSESNPIHRSHDMGMKLAHGFEILCARCTGKSASSSNEQEVNEVRWQRYLQSLKDKDYFRGELKGSRLYNELIKSAKEYYTEIMVHSDNIERTEPGHQVLEILHSNKVSFHDLKVAEKNLQPEDDDSWLFLTPDQLEQMLHEAVGKSTATSLPDEKDLLSAMSYDLGSVADNMKAFVNKVSSHEGAEFPKMSENAQINFDSSGFLEALENMLGGGFREPKSDDSGDDSSGFLDDDEEEEYDLDDDDELEGEAAEMKEMMEQMDRELSQTMMGKSFEKQTEKKPTSSKTTSQDEQEDAKYGGSEEPEDIPAVDVDVNLLKNLLESYSSQQGLAGPTSNLLHSMGMKLPHDMDDLD